MIYEQEYHLLLLNLISVPVDALMLILAGVSSFYIRLHSVEIVGPIIFQLQLRSFLVVVMQFLPFLLLILAFLGLYNLKGTRKFTYEFGRIIIGVSLALLLIIFLFFFNQTFFPSRFIILSTWG